MAVLRGLSSEIVCFMEELKPSKCELDPNFLICASRGPSELWEALNSLSLNIATRYNQKGKNPCRFLSFEDQ